MNSQRFIKTYYNILSLRREQNITKTFTITPTTRQRIDIDGEIAIIDNAITAIQKEAFIL
jgi:hypothetical protein